MDCCTTSCWWGCPTLQMFGAGINKWGGHVTLLCLCNVSCSAATVTVAVAASFWWIETSQSKMMMNFYKIATRERNNPQEKLSLVLCLAMLLRLIWSSKFDEEENAVADCFSSSCCYLQQCALSKATNSLATDILLLHFLVNSNLSREFALSQRVIVIGKCMHTFLNKNVHTLNLCACGNTTDPIFNPTCCWWNILHFCNDVTLTWPFFDMLSLRHRETKLVNRHFSLSYA